ncbi:MAG TPA: hypothetical protein DCQ92_07145 [Verrucomicrobia subdivision 3 bacterium]|nr:hypothetical protein [Limisphaerales bacterium]
MHAQVVVAIGQNFTGSTYGDISQALPPDANGAIGPSHFVEFINGTVAFYNKTNVQDAVRITDVDFWTETGLTISSASAVTDPRVIYDPTSQRWFASQVDFNATVTDPTRAANNFLLAVSATSDPTGPWQGFRFRADPSTGRFADFPTLGVDANGVYISGDFIHAQTNVGPGLVSIPKADLLAATPTIANRTWFGVMSYTNRGQVLQPAICFDGSSTGSVLAMGDIGNDSDPHSNVVSFAVQNAASPGATLTAPTSINVSPYVVPFNSDLGYPLFNPVQPDGSTTLQVNDGRISAKVYAIGGVLYAVHNTEVNGRIAIRWYRINAATHALLESGTIADSDLDLFFPSIAANAGGTVVIGYNGSSINTFVSCFAIVGATVNGVTTFGSPVLLQAGVVSYHDANELLAQLLDDPVTDSRWGDYSATSVDPTDPNRFWIIQMYPSGVDSSSGFDVGIWSTQISEILTANPVLSITVSNANAVVSWPGTAITFNLESNTNLLAANGWTVVTPNFSTNNGQVYYQTSLTNGVRFFRLHKP